MKRVDRYNIGKEALKEVLDMEGISYTINSDIVIRIENIDKQSDRERYETLKDIEKLKSELNIFREINLFKDLELEDV